MSIEERIDNYLDRVLRYLDTPWMERDPGEYEELMALKAEIYATSKR